MTRWEKVDDHTVRIHTSEPAANLWDFIGREPLVPRAWTVKNGVEALNERPVGTGPWKLVEWKRKNHMLFERNERYWGAPPRMKRLRFVIIPEAAARIAALRAGQVGLIEAVPPLDADVLEREPTLRVVSSVQKLACRIYLNGRTKDAYESGGRDGAFADPRVRLALNLAVNREAIVQKIFHGLAIVNASPRRDRGLRVCRAGGLSVRPGPREGAAGRGDRQGRPAEPGACCFPPSTTARPSTRRCRRWSRC